MKNSIHIILLFILINTTFIMLFQSCSDNSTNTQQSSLSGTVTFNDEHFFNSSYAYYAVSIFADSTSPFSKAPLRNDSLRINTSGGIATAYYKFSNLPDGNYYVGVTWITVSGTSDVVLGTLGCDTNANCTSTIVTFPNYAGTGDQNFRSKTNIYAPLFHHP